MIVNHAVDLWRKRGDSNPRSFRTPAFKAGAFGRSATLPLGGYRPHSNPRSAQAHRCPDVSLCHHTTPWSDVPRRLWGGQRPVWTTFAPPAAAGPARRPPPDAAIVTIPHKVC